MDPWMRTLVRGSTVAVVCTGLLLGGAAGAAPLVDASGSGSAPAEISPPTISGTVQQGSTLTEHHGAWTNSPISYHYQWQDCYYSGATCWNITGATGLTYTLKGSDVGQRVTVEEWAANSLGTGGPATATPTPVVAALPGTLTLDGTFKSGLTPWTARGGGAQCANYGMASTPPRLRGDLYISSNTAGQYAGQFVLPADSNPSTYPLEACSLGDGSIANILPADTYYGLMVYIPSGWKIPNNAFNGVEIAEYHFQNVYGAPISFQLHPDHITLALELGACGNSTPAPACQYRSNADAPTCTSTSSYTCLPAYYVVPRNALVQGAWNEIVMHVHWASNSAGQIQTWYRAAGTSTWQSSATVSGYPTVQWNSSKGCCGSSYSDFIEAYASALSAPLSVWMANELIAPDFATVASNLP